MPLFQVIYQAINSNGSGVISSISKGALLALSYFEVLFRLAFRLLILPEIFHGVFTWAIFNTFLRILSYIPGLDSWINEALSELFGTQNHSRTSKTLPNQSAASGMFTTPPSILGVIPKTWLISDYFYDRLVLHAPFCILALILGEPVEKYTYRSRRTFSRHYSDGEIVKLKETIEKVTEPMYLNTLKSFNLNSPNSSPIQKKSSGMSYHSLTPGALLTENSKNVHKISSLASQRSYSKDLFSSRSDNFVNDVQSDNSIVELSPKPVMSKPILEVSPARHSSIKIKFNRRRHSSGSSFKRSNSKKNKQNDTSSIEESTATPKNEDYEAVREEIRATMVAPDDFDEGSFGPLFVRLAWHTSATYDRKTNTGGSNGGTMRFPPELADSGNTGLHTALLTMEMIKQKFPWITYGDLWTLGGVTALEAMGSHPIDWRPGRIDCTDASKIPPNGRLPLGYLGRDHIREVFVERLGFDEREAVLLIGGGHSLGRCHVKYSGWEGKWTENPIHFSNRFFTALLNEDWEPMKVAATGRDQYYNAKNDLMMLNTDMELMRDPIFLKWSEYYANDNEIFLQDFAKVFAKLIELGVSR